MVEDVIVKPCRSAVRALLPDLQREKSIDYVICTGENTASGFGSTADTASELLGSGADALTSGNRIRDKKEIIPLMDEGLPLIRHPLPGLGHRLPTTWHGLPTSWRALPSRWPRVPSHWKPMIFRDFFANSQKKQRGAPFFFHDFSEILTIFLKKMKHF